MDTLPLLLILKDLNVDLSALKKRDATPEQRAQLLNVFCEAQWFYNMTRNHNAAPDGTDEWHDKLQRAGDDCFRAGIDHTERDEAFARYQFRTQEMEGQRNLCQSKSK